ncbi:serine hydrolase domain-containing protein [Roseateles toxinivorans]|uniref:CubicO group peptidase (Beta-lactamase class C family) n=1 Tax=Roseateles toxinivorans TaxID=270368 RepID=A0A4R6QS01_9BURK|nr:serine hydrolase domain-containing protein [Roseateles toxinivorans]TDP73025.1 CubicO group peptidase (beta-lactamase class C family) [Roseateles toxinivorans]
MSESTSTAALDELFQPLNRSDAPGLVVGVARHGKLLYRRGFGLASIEHGRANTPTTRMRIGSTSKHFTCLAALLLAEDGKLNIDGGVRTYLPELPLLKGEPTLRQFMNHTSGYRCYLDVNSMASSMAVPPRGAALATLVGQTEVNFAPGEKMMYNNGGYHLLSLVIQKVSGQPFEQFLKERIFTPLGMVDTVSMPSDMAILPGVATLHVPQPPELGGGWRRGLFPSEEVRGEGAMVSTVDDMLVWLAHLRSPRKIVGSVASWEQMVTLTRLDNGVVSPYALGLMRHPYRGVEVIHHAGGVVGGTCQMLTVPSHGLDIIMMINGAPADPRELANKIVDRVLGDSVLGAVVKKPAAARFKAMLGSRYHAPGSGLVFGFAEAAEGRLGLSFLNSPPVPLREEGDTLRLGFEDVALGPLELKTAQLATEGEAPAALDFSEAGHGERFERLPATPPALAEVAAPLLGRYKARDLDADATLCFVGEQLQLQIRGPYGPNPIALEAFSAEVFGWKDLDPAQQNGGMGALSVERREGRVMGFRLNTSRTRHMWFERQAD